MTIHLKKAQRTKSGFTLVELIVSIGIMILILSVMLVNYSRFDTGIILTNLAYDVGLSIRQAQTYGISVKGIQQGGSSDQTFSYRYGISFDLSTLKEYNLFVDINDDKIYNSGASPTEQVEKFTLQGSYRVRAICTQATGGSPTCYSTGKKVDISFLRPNPDATIYVNGVPTQDAIHIQIMSNRDTSTYKTVVIRSTGQISVQ